MKLIKKYYLNLIVLILGVILLAMGGAIFLTANIGSDSLMVFNQGVSVILNRSIDKGIIISNLVALFVILVINRKLIGLGSFAILFFLGPLVEFFKNLSFFQTPGSLVLQILMVLLGIIIGGLGIALYMYADLGLSPFEGIIVTISDRKKWRFGYVKIFFDAFFFATGALLGGKFGIGSILTVFLYGPTIDLFSKLLKKSNLLKNRS